MENEEACKRESKAGGKAERATAIWLGSPVMNKSPVDSLCARKLATTRAY